MDLTEFLAARLDELAAAAQAAEGSEWTAKPVIYGPADEGWGDPEDAPWEIYAGRTCIVSHQMHEGGGINGGGTARHIACHDPDRVLREVEAKRALIAVHQTEVIKSGPEGIRYWCETCHVPRDRAGRNYCPTLRHLAAVYSDHPDYRAEWKP